jgi:hypothetical protein
MAREIRNVYEELTAPEKWSAGPVNVRSEINNPDYGIKI